MLVVVGILGILMATAYTGLTQAQRQGRKAKAETEIRQLVGAWLTYEGANDDWPANMPADGTPVDATRNILGELLGDTGGPVYLNVQFRGDSFLDPWGTPYRIKITPPEDAPEIKDVFSAAVSFPNRNRPRW